MEKLKQDLNHGNGTERLNLASIADKTNAYSSFFLDYID
jgi:hypothetical protein